MRSFIPTSVFPVNNPRRNTINSSERVCDTNMKILRHIRGLRFVTPHTRYIQSSPVIFRALNVEINNSSSEDPFRFDDGTRIFASKRTSEIFRSLFVLNLCSYDIVARNSMVVRTKHFIIKQ